MEDVAGVEPDSRTALRARQNLAGIGTVTVREASFGAISLDKSSYDVVTFVAVLHHLPLRQTLVAARALLRPGGRLVIVGLARETSADMPWSLMSMILNPVIGVIRHPRRARVIPENMTAPTSEPCETFEQIAAVENELLPGAVVRRRLFWRYTAVWAAPTPDGAPTRRTIVRD
jgi:SAM-dependent methyltransferase